MILSSIFLNNGSMTKFWTPKVIKKENFGGSVFNTTFDLHWATSLSLFWFENMINLKEWAKKLCERIIAKFILQTKEVAC